MKYYFHLANTYIFFIFVGSPLKLNFHMRRWKDVNSSDIKVFIAHLIVMGSVKKPNMANYLSLNELTKIEFFGKYMCTCLGISFRG